MLVLDVDAGDPLLVAELLKKFTCVIHSTYKHGPKQGRCRIVFLLAEECRSARDLNDARVYLETWLAKYTITAPAKDAATGRLAYLPMHQEGTAPVCIVNTGSVLTCKLYLFVIVKCGPHRLLRLRPAPDPVDGAEWA